MVLKRIPACLNKLELLGAWDETRLDTNYRDVRFEIGDDGTVWIYEGIGVWRWTPTGELVNANPIAKL